MSLTLILAVLLDQWLGEPKKYHPLVFFGTLANQVENEFRRSTYSDNQQRLWGLFALILMVCPFSLLVYILSQFDLINSFIAPIIVYLSIAPKSLKQHAISVLNALNLHDLALAQKQVGMIVSRQTDKMTEEDVRKACIESVLENGADAIFAPVFWFIIAGPTGVIVYRLSNTLDAMWGYKSPRFLHFGWAAARFDDVLNWIPSRLTALSYALLGNTKLALKCWKEQAHLLDSPNAGVVMTSGAGSLNLKLGGAAWYHGKIKQKVFFGGQNNPLNNDIYNANTLITRCLYLWILAVIILDFLGNSFA
ncbi:MAG: cobalamin biosynthesis protein [Methylococcales bacterium]|nr:cobalamin biosynthesis protein [Methylococcales bacterium]